MTLTDAQMYQEKMATIRHYSNLRFAMLTLFILITGGLLSAKYSTTIEINENILSINIINFVGIWISSVFLIFEIALNFYLSGLWEETNSSSSKYRSGFLTWPVRIGSVSITILTGLYWCLY